jgi:hypothetical protein
MKSESHRRLGRPVLAGLLLLLGFGGFTWFQLRHCYSLYCVAPTGLSATQCTEALQHQAVRKLPLSDSRELIIEEAAVTRDQFSVTVSVKLQGEFHNEPDQNLYVFVGQAPNDGAPSSYSLSSDEQYFKDLSYTVRNTIQLPHSNEIRIGIMSPQESAYTPQVYVSDPVYADFVGSSAHIGIETSGHQVRLLLPLAEYYRRRGTTVPDVISMTVTTARDYVGFVDQISVTNVRVGDNKREDRKSLPPIFYPSLRYDSHIFKSVTLQQTNGSANVEFEMLAEIEDWAQTDLHFFFVPYPPSGWTGAPLDPSKTTPLPYRWSFYCGVYSPNRIFCKASDRNDLTYDKGYAGRPALEQPAGVRFRVHGGAKYSLELAPPVVEQIKRNRGTFALLLTAGRDGFGPTSRFGWECAGLCGFLHGLFSSHP